MTPTARCKLGILLLVIAALAAVGMSVTVLTQGSWQVAGAGSTANGGWMAMAPQQPISGLCLLWLVPIIVGGATGLFCLLRPQRKPPKLRQ